MAMGEAMNLDFYTEARRLSAIMINRGLMSHGKPEPVKVKAKRHWTPEQLQKRQQGIAAKKRRRKEAEETT
jgi:macrodomain Ter protein organizer (MatP/YcbG family)